MPWGAPRMRGLHLNFWMMRTSHVCKSSLSILIIFGPAKEFANCVLNNSDDMFNCFDTFVMLGESDFEFNFGELHVYS